jgi:CheY-like chemotaxis protein
MLPGSQPPIPSGPPLAAEAPGANSLRVLIVEDEPEIARLVAVTLTPLRLDMRIATTGPQALEVFAQLQPHLVILDIMLPEMDGHEVCARIRAVSTVPIIMMTARDSDQDQLSGLKAGADDYITKPFVPKVLAARVAAQLRRVYKYDAQPTREETEADRRQQEANRVLGIAPMPAGGERKVPPGWAACGSCGYMGPRPKFDKADSQGRKRAACPVCNSTDHVTFSLG